MFARKEKKEMDASELKSAASCITSAFCQIIIVALHSYLLQITVLFKVDDKMEAHLSSVSMYTDFPFFVCESIFKRCLDQLCLD
jgi:hypothetical protein